MADTWLLRVLVPATLISVPLLYACGGTEAAPESELAQRGRVIYLRACSVCHGSGGEGRSRLGAALVDNVFVRERSDRQLVEFLKRGRPASHPENRRGIDMPPRGGDPGLDEGDLRALVAYLRTLQE